MSLSPGVYYDPSLQRLYLRTSGATGVVTGMIVDNFGKVAYGVADGATLIAQVTISGNSAEGNPPLRLVGLEQSEYPRYVVVDSQGNLGYRSDIVTGVTVNGNTIYETVASGTTSSFTVNAITAGTYSNGTITVEGSGSITNITGIKTLYDSDGTLSSNRVINTGAYTTTFSGASSEMIKVVYTGNTSTDKVLSTGSGSTTNFYVTANGDLFATSKSFLIPHQSKEGYMLRHGSLEGPEHGVYHRGKLTNSNVIELPEYWSWLVDESTITIQLTSIGKFQKYQIVSISNNQIVLSNSDNSDNLNCFYIIHGERKDIDKLVVEEII